MFEKVNPAHPDKVADRIAGAIVDLAYRINDNPKVAVEVLIGHGVCHIIAESSVEFDISDIESIVKRISKQYNIVVDFKCVPQDIHLAENQSNKIRCGDNGIFKGVPITTEQQCLEAIAKALYDEYGTDGKYIYNEENNKLIICQSNANTDELKRRFTGAIINPLGDWTGGTDVDCGATNRKLGSDMGDAVTGGGLHGKDLSKADVSINIYAHIKANKLNKTVELCCAIGDEIVDGRQYSTIVEIAREYINKIGGFERLAEWGLTYNNN